MAFTGDLEQFPIVDVIQLLHSTKKSGTLCVKGRKGEGKLVFSNGFIISANHADNSTRVGKILVEMNAVITEVIDQALLNQKKNKAKHKPLIGMLIEQGQIKKEEAYKGLEILIEMAIVEMLTWNKGTFTLNVDEIDISDEFRYFPEKLQQEINLDTQMALMDALRIFDEKKRDGELEEEDLSGEEPSLERNVASEKEHLILSADILGLEDLDQLDRKIPEIFSALETFDPSEIHRQKIKETAENLSADEQEKLASFLVKFSAKQGGQPRAIILFSRDELINHSVMTVGKHEGILVYATDKEQDLDRIIDQSLSRKIVPILVFDSPDQSEKGFSKENIVHLRQRKKEKYPQVSTIQLASPLDYDFSLQAFNDGVRAVLPRPLKEERKETFVEDTIKFLETFRSYTSGYFNEQGQHLLSKLKKSVSELQDIKKAPEVSFALLRSVSETFERSITFIVRKTELIAEKGIGVKGDKSEGAIPAMRFKIPLTEPSIFRKVVEEGNLFYGESDDETLKNRLFETIGAPLTSNILLLPVKIFGRAIALTYGDFGTKEASSVPLDILEILASQAGLVLENSLYRIQFEKTS
jgi:hypothetical protein